jgi:hypothetical protein
MPNDPNWLFSTIAQSSAAIVAIIGGFVTATVLSLSAEKRSLTNQRNDKETRLQTLRDEKEVLSQELDEKEVNDFIEYMTDKIIDVRDMPSLEKVVEENREAQRLNHKILKREYEVLVGKIAKAGKFFTEHLGEVHPQSVTFADWVKLNNIDISQYDYHMLERLYDKILKQKLEQRQASLLAWERDTLSLTLSGMSVPYTTPISEQQEMGRLKQKIQEDAGEIAALKNDVDNIDFRISKFSYPPNMGWSIVVLGFLTVFGILLPTLIIADEAFFSWAKLLTLVTFWVGIIGVFTYIVSQIRTLKK